jgi:hypothetical protein
MPTLTREIIEAAIAGFESQKQRIDAQISELRAMLKGADSTTETKGGRRKRKLSPEALQRMREGQQRRWARVKGVSPKANVKPAKAKRRLSPEGKAAIVAALKKRWAAKKARGGTTPAVKAAGPKKAA